MSSLDETFDDVREAATDLLNAEGRSTGHVALGVVLTIGFALAATALASGSIRPRQPTARQIRRGDRPVTERPRGAFGLVLPAVFSATTLSAVRVWNAPASPARTGAMTLWAAAQMINALWLGLRPSSLRAQMLAAMSSAGLAAAFAHEARKLDEGAGKIAAPTGAGVHVGNYIQRRVQEHTLH